MRPYPCSDPEEALPPPPVGHAFEPFEEADFVVPMTELFDRRVAQHPNALALEGSTTLTYKELHLRSRALALAITRLSPVERKRIAILSHPDTGYVLGALAILRAGSAFCPLDPDEPHERLCSAMLRSGVGCMLVDPSLTELAQDLVADSGIGLLPLDLADLDSSSQSSEDLPGIHPEDLACIFQTSGSTGEPVSVRIQHTMLSFDTCRQVNDLSIGSEDRLDLLFSPAFSAALAPTFAALVSGASLHFLNLRKAGVGALPKWLRRRKISISNQSTSTLRSWLTHLPELTGGDGLLPDLRLLCVGGEPLLASDLSAAKPLFDAGCTLQNAMAATETRTYAQLFLKGPWPDGDPVPVGYPVLGREIRVSPEGELVVRSDSLAEGYEGDPERTIDRFRASGEGLVNFHTGDRGHIDAKGRVFPLGRLDSLVKVRGHRVDLQEVEGVLRELPYVESSAAMLTSGVGSSPVLGAVITPSVPAEAMPSMPHLREQLAERLPKHAIPSVLLMLDSLPINANGKVDRSAIASQLTPAQEGLGERRTHSTETRDKGETQDLLEAAFAECLGVKEVGADTDFFFAGGDSLMALDLLASIQRRLGVQIGHPELLSHPTPAALTTLAMDESRQQGFLIQVRESIGDGSASPVVLLPAITGLSESLLNLGRLTQSNNAFYLLNAIPTGAGGPLEYTIPAIASRYADELQERFGSTPLVLVGFSWGGLVAQELAIQLVNRRCPVRFIMLLDAPVPTVQLSRPPHRVQLWRDRLRNLPYWIWYDLFEFELSALLTRIKGWLVEKRGLHGDGSSPNLGTYFGRSGLSSAFEQGFKIRYQATLAHRPGQWDGECIVVRSLAQSLRDPRRGSMGWEGFCSQAPTCLTIRGHHESFLTEPYVQELVDELDQRLG